MRFKQVRRKATAIALSAAMAFSFNVATPTSVKAAEKTTLSQRVGSVFDMKDGTVNGELNFSFLKHVTMEEALAAKGSSSTEITYSPEYGNDLMDLLIGLKAKINKPDGEAEWNALKKTYGNYLLKIGLAKLDIKDPGDKDDDSYVWASEKLNLKLRFEGKMKDKYNGNIIFYIKLADTKENKLITLKVDNGKFLVDPMEICEALSYYLDETPRVIFVKLFNMSISAKVEVDLFDSLRNMVEKGYEEYQQYVKNDPENAEKYKRDYRSAIMAYNILQHIAKVNKSDDSSFIGKTAVDAIEKIVSVAGIAVDDCYDKASTNKDGKNIFDFNEKSFSTLVDLFVTNVRANKDKLKNGIKGITSFVFDESFKEDIDKEFDGMIDNFVEKTDEYVKFEPKDKAEYLKGLSEEFTKGFKSLSLTGILTGDKGARDYEAGINAVIPVRASHIVSDEEPVVTFKPYQELTIDFKFSMKEPDAGKVKPAPEKMGPKVGSTIKDKNCSYKVITQGSDKKVGEVEVKKANKKNVKKVVIKGTVKINGVKYKVTSIGAKAFKGNKKLTKVTIGKNVKRIKSNAFAGCSALKTVVSKSKVLSRIDKGAFAKDAKLTSVNFKLSTKLNKIAKGAFKGVKKSCKISVNKKLKKKLVKKLKKAGCKATVK